MKRLLLLLALCLALSACSGAAKETELTVEEAREVLSEALLERDSSYLSYDLETGFDADGIHYVWGDLFWNEEVSETTVEGREVYCFDLVYGPDADDGLEDAANPMAGRLLMSCGAGKDGESLWLYRQDLGEWEPLTGSK